MSQPVQLTPSFYDAAWQQWQDMIRYSPAPRFRRNRLLSWIRTTDGCRSLLDVGCGNGEFLLQVGKNLPGIEFTGADVSPGVIESNNNAYPGMSFSVLDLNHEQLNRKFDIVTCMEVVEHCTDYRQAIAGLAAMTGGWLLLTVPCGPLFEIDRRVGHTRHFSPSEIRSALEAAGLEVVRLESWGFPFFNIYKHLINLNPDKACKTFLSKQNYSFLQKALTSAVYLSFRLCLPYLGYQLFAMARKK